MEREFDCRDLIIFKAGTDFKFKIGIKNKDKIKVKDLLDKNWKIYPIEEVRDIKEVQDYIRLLISDYKIRDSRFYKLNELPKILRGTKRLIKQF
ncbi:MAG: hypothetical protein PHS54_02490, partial [Clostridia bacterium]|nr:hypothetical protein [Clostridia bacterium]